MDYYSILGVQKDANSKQIKKAYHKKAMKELQQHFECLVRSYFFGYDYDCQKPQLRRAILVPGFNRFINCACVVESATAMFLCGACCGCECFLSCVPLQLGEEEKLAKAQ